MTVLGTIHQRLGELDEGVAVVTEALQSAHALKDPQVELRLRERLVGLLQDQGNLPRALEEAGVALRILTPQMPGWYIRVKQATLVSRLGRGGEAKQSLADLDLAMHADSAKPWLPILRLAQAELAYTDGRFSEAGALAHSAVTSSIDDDANRQSAKLVLALVAMRSRKTSQGVALADDVIRTREQMHLIVGAAEARLSAAEALVQVGDRTAAGGYASAAAAFFDPRHIWEATWRAHAVAAATSGTDSDARTSRAASRDAFNKLRDTWPASHVEQYLQRAAITLPPEAGQP